MDARARALAQKVWDYHHLNHELTTSDVILVLCSHDTIVAERGAQLFLDKWAPLLIFSGGLGTITKHLWTDPEADRFARIAREMGLQSPQAGQVVRMDSSTPEGSGSEVASLAAVAVVSAR